MHVYDITQPDAIKAAGALTNLGGSILAVDVSSHLAPPEVDDFALLANSQFGLQAVNVNDPTQPVLESAAGGDGVSAVAVEVQQMDRFLDEQGRQLKENSHPFVDTLTRQDIERILSVPDVEFFQDEIRITGLNVAPGSVRIQCDGLAPESAAYVPEAAPTVLGPWQGVPGAEILPLEPARFEARFPLVDGRMRFFQIKRFR